MRKIPTLFARNHNGDKQVRNEVTPGCEWVLAGEGTATRKYDGLAILIRDGQVFKRYDAKPGRTPPPAFEPCDPAPDPVSGHWPGWVPIDERADGIILEGLRFWRLAHSAEPANGTYEVCSPKIGTRGGADPERLPWTIMVRHGALELEDMPRSFEGIRAALDGARIEGIVFHHPDGRMAKIKTKDFGLVVHPVEALTA